MTATALSRSDWFKINTRRANADPRDYTAALVKDGDAISLAIVAQLRDHADLIEAIIAAQDAKNDATGADRPAAIKALRAAQFTYLWTLWTEYKNGAK